MEKQNWTVRAVGWTWRVIMTLTLGILLLCQSWNYAAKAELPWSNWLCLIVGLAGMGLLAALAWVIMKPAKSRKIRLAVMGCLCAAAAVGIFYSAAHYAFTAGWDPAFLYETAYNMAYGFEGLGDVDPGYFSQYPNNLLLTVVYSWIFRLAPPLGLEDQEYFLLLGAQSLGFGLTLYLIYLCAEKITDWKHPGIALWCWTAGLLLVGISPWVAVQYTDTAALPLVMTEVWLFLKIRDGKRQPVWIGALMLVTALAFRVKPQTAILTIAAALMSLLGEGKTWLDRTHLKRSLAAAAACAVGLGAGILGGGMIIRSSGMELNADERFGLTHFLMMGLNETDMGSYSVEDVKISTYAANQAERREVNLRETGKRIREMGIPGLWRQAVRKTLTNYGDGTFAWEQEGMFYSYDSYYFRQGSEWGFENIPPFYISAEYEEMVEESHSEIWRTMVQCTWLAVLALGLFSWRRKDGDREKVRRAGVLQLAILGLTLFELLFEARARYLFAYAPVYILLAGLGVLNLQALAAGFLKNRNDGLKAE